MTISHKTIDTAARRGGADDALSAYISIVSGMKSISFTLAVNPRGGDMVVPLKDKGTVIDSFVSDDEWVEAAGAFSRKVYAGYSHHPLLQVADASYDLVMVCEDIGFVDDCDAMLQEYFRLLKPGGALLGGLWNISYADSIDSLLCSGKSALRDELCGGSLIPLDCLTARFGELGFTSATIYRLPGTREDVAAYADVSSRNLSPVAAEEFGTRIYIVCARK